MENNKYFDPFDSCLEDDSVILGGQRYVENIVGVLGCDDNRHNICHKNIQQADS